MTIAMPYPDRQDKKAGPAKVDDVELKQAQAEAAREFDKFDRLLHDFRKMDHVRLVLVRRK